MGGKTQHQDRAGELCKTLKRMSSDLEARDQGTYCGEVSDDGEEKVCLSGTCQQVKEDSVDQYLP